MPLWSLPVAFLSHRTPQAQVEIEHCAASVSFTADCGAFALVPAN